MLIDTSGNGFRLTSAINGVYFHPVPGTAAVKIAWTAVGSDDAFLVLDRNGNGAIDDGSELFGNATPQPTSPTPNGFLALAEFDKSDNGGNGDGIIDVRDAIFTRLRLWIDSNHDGISQLEELFTLPDKGITGVALDYSESRRRDEFGNLFRYRARVIEDSGVSRWAYDIFLGVQNTSSQKYPPLQMEAQVRKMIISQFEAAGLSASQFTRTQYPTLTGAFSPEVSNIEPASIVLTNDTDRKIVGVAVRWNITDPEGHTRHVTYRSDSFMSAGAAPVAVPHSRLLGTPSIFLPEDLITGQFVALTRARMRDYVTTIENAASVVIEVDSVIFEDGEVVGPNQLRYDSEITARKSAAEDVTKQVRQALARGETAAILLSRMAEQHPPRTDHARSWTRRFATELMTSRDLEAAVSSLEHLPKPPAFFQHTNP